MHLPFSSRRRLTVEGSRPRRESGHVAFVLGGGGSRGAAQVGMLAALLERGITPNRIYGASVGAINAASFSGDPTLQGVDRLAHTWLGLDADAVFPRGRFFGPWQFLQSRSAVHDALGVRALITAGLRYEHLQDSPIPIEVVATVLGTGEERWFREGPALPALLASAAIPGVLPPVNIDGEVLIDGGVVNNVPISQAIKNGATTIYVLLCGPLHPRTPYPKRPIEAIFAAGALARAARFPRELADLPPGVSVVVFSPGSEGSDYRDFSQTPYWIDAGRREVARVLDESALSNTNMVK